MENLTDSQPAGEPVAAESPDGCPQNRTEKFVTFSLGDGSYAVLAAAVAEVIHRLPLTTLPVPVPGLLGISPLRGEIVAMLNIRQILSEAVSSGSDSKSKQIVLKRNGPDLAPIAFEVDRIGEIAAIDLSRVRSIACGSAPLIGETNIDDRTVKVINHVELAAAAALD